MVGRFSKASAFLPDNQEFKFLFTAIDTFSNYVWAAPITDKVAPSGQ